jgi:hypothetical protein
MLVKACELSKVRIQMTAGSNELSCLCDMARQFTQQITTVVAVFSAYSQASF